MNILDEIFAAKRARAEEVHTAIELKELIRKVKDCEPTKGFHQRLLNSPHRVSLIAEVKKASPVKGLIRENFDPVEIALAYLRAGADCLSVLTDVPYFQGHPSFLTSCRADTGLPCLRKDFTVDHFDIYEARVIGADAILLIAYGLSDLELREFRELAEELEMDAIVEVHTEAEADRAVASGASLIGVNNRDLTSFKTSVEAGLRVLPHLKGKATLIGESAISCVEDVIRLAAAGARSVLVGTAFCREADVEAKVREVMGWPGA